MSIKYLTAAVIVFRKFTFIVQLPHPTVLSDSANIPVLLIHSLKKKENKLKTKKGRYKR